MKKIYVLVSLAIAMSSPAQAQQKGIGQLPNRGCGTPAPNTAWDQWFNQQVENYKKDLVLGKAMVMSYTIPVIMHVIHGGEAVGTYPNIPEAQLKSQIDVLNADYSGTGFNVGLYSTLSGTNTPFNNYAAANSLPSPNSQGVVIANTGIQFCLVTRDSLGNVLAEPGIERIDYHTKGWSNPAASWVNTPIALMSLINDTIKPATIWNPKKYLNVWVTDELQPSGPGLLGYATFPAGATLTGLPGSGGTNLDDGFWNVAYGMGNTSTVGAPYNLGRTCTHEIGHWLGLRHMWGDGNCLTDYCNDTPPAAAANYVNVNAGYPFHAGTCTGSPDNSTDGEMWMNFMDYGNDSAIFMFTTDQTARIQTAMQTGIYRMGLTGSSATTCDTTGLNGIKATKMPAHINVYPNPSVGTFYVAISLGQTSDISIIVTNVLGQNIYQKNEAGVLQNRFTLDLAQHGKGIYFVTINSKETGKVMKKIIIE